MTTEQREPSAVGRLILDALHRHSLSRPAVAAALGINRRFMWEIIWGYRPVPAARLQRLSEALQLTREEQDALNAAHISDRLHRSGRFRASPGKLLPPHSESQGKPAPLQGRL